ncbi:MAG: hypothetical protein VB099_15435 [Candidatus Limiplasma sp.]|nr:hypothetical protein [Candidatus Limiplasma sp.]
MKNVWKKGVALMLVLCLIMTTTLTVLATEEAMVEASMEAPVEEIPTEVPVEEVPTEAPAEEIPTEAPAEMPSEEPSKEEPTIDTTRAASHSPQFTAGLAETIGSTTLFENNDLSVVLGIMEANGVIDVKSRDGNTLEVRVKTIDDSIVGFVSATDVRPLSDKEAAAYEANPVPVQYAPKVAEQEATPVEEKAEKELQIDTTRAASFSPDFTQGLAITIAATMLYEDSELTVSLGEIDVGGVVEAKSRAANTLEISAVLVDGSLAGYVSAGDVRPLSADETAAYKANPTAVQYAAVEPALMSAMLFALPGAVPLTAGTTTTLSLPAYAGSGSDKYASFTMATAGLLTITFKSSGNASGNLTLMVADASDSSELWSGSLVPSGTTNFSMFVEAGDYDITLSKSDAGDASGYSVGVTPIVSLAGELGTKNNTQNNAADLALNSGSASTGIYSAQDLNKRRDDYYRLSLSSAGKLTLSATNMIPGELEVFIYGDDTSTGNEIASMTINVGAASENGGITMHRSGWFDAGTYYITVHNKTAFGRYRLQADIATVTLTEREPNSTPSQAYSSGSTVVLNSGVYVDSLLSESDLRDYYYFYLPSATSISASVKAQLSEINLYICDQGGKKVAGSDFGGQGGGSYGNPYEYELKSLTLQAGYYYLCADKVTETGLYSVRANSVLTVSSVTATVSGSGENQNVLNVSAVANGGPGAITLHRYNVYLVEGGKSILVTTRESKTTSNMAFTLNRAGSYIIQYVCTNGLTWAEGWSTQVVVSVKPLKVETLLATSNAAGQIKCKATVSGINPVTECIFSLYRNGVVVDRWYSKNALEYTFNAPVSGLYSVQYTITDGYVWVDGWTTCNATVPLPLKIASLTTSVDNSGNVVGRITIQDGYPLQYGIYKIYNSKTEVIASYATTALQHSFKIATNDSYLMQFVGYDGKTWADNWASFTVSSASNTLEITSLTATSNDAGAISCSAATSGGGKVIDSWFNLYSGGVYIGRVINLNQSATFNVYANGPYTIQYVASDDGKRYVDKWANVNVTLSPQHYPVQIADLNIKSDDATGILTCTTTTQYGGALTASWFNLYNSKSELIDSFRSVSTKTTKFYVNSNGTYNVQAVVSDGKVWVEKWGSVTITGFQDDTPVLEVKASASYNNNTLICTATANQSTPLRSEVFVLYLVDPTTGQSTELRRFNASNKTATLKNLALSQGKYLVQFVAFDGVTWTDGWTEFTVGSSSLSVDSVTAAKSGSSIACRATYTSNYNISTARFKLYVGENCVSAWEWNGAGNLNEHVFNVANADQITSVQYVIFNGIEWADGWAVPS